ncbi:hypothetical protein EDC94DRAFT_614022 [Helicostylum pulchrum]|nr:hypothetical protein EDC94DRAFT_614022 [Helicostylum pulchrum]
MSSSKVDPRKEEAIVPFHLPRKNEQEEEYNSTLATFIAMAGIMTRNQYKVIPWIAAYFGLVAVLNNRKTMKAKDSIGSSGSMLAFISLFTYYLNVYLVNKRAMDPTNVSEGL